LVTFAPVILKTNRTMKKVFVILAVAAAFAACNNAAETTEAVVDSAAATIDSAAATVDTAAVAIDSAVSAVVDSAAATVDSLKK
jgi:uncharacterized lipoprotein YajG